MEALWGEARLIEEAWLPVALECGLILDCLGLLLGLSRLKLSSHSYCLIIRIVWHINSLDEVQVLSHGFQKTTLFVGSSRNLVHLKITTVAYYHSF